MVEQKIINIADNPRYENKTPELCVICHKETPYTFDTPIDQRRYYYEGVGQLCRDCYREIVNYEIYKVKNSYLTLMTSTLSFSRKIALTIVKLLPSRILCNTIMNKYKD